MTKHDKQFKREHEPVIRTFTPTSRQSHTDIRGLIPAVSVKLVIRKSAPKTRLRRCETMTYVLTLQTLTPKIMPKTKAAAARTNTVAYNVTLFFSLRILGKRNEQWELQMVKRQLTDMPKTLA